MLKINNSRPDKIFANGVEILGANVNEEGVWGKEFTLTYSTGEGYEISVERVSSNFENASLGMVENGGEIFYGDNLYLYIENQEGSNVSSVTIDGNLFDFFENHVVTKDMDIVANVASGQWNTIFSGVCDSAMHYATTTSIYIVEIEGIDEDKPLRVCAELMDQSNKVLGTYENIEIEHKNNEYTCLYKNKFQTLGGYSNGRLAVKLTRPSPTFFYKPMFWRITKIEQFY